MRIVQCHGCFDLLHIGHIRHLIAAKQAGDCLWVTVTPDRFVNKGPRRPVFSEQLRVEALRALSCVDNVSLTESPTAAEAIRQIRPAVFAKGSDYSAATMDPGELAALADVGGQLVITETQKWSSTALLPQLQADPYLTTIRATYTLADVQTWLEKARSLKVLVIGDAILDEYQYCNTLGKSGKEPMLAAQFVRAEQFIGGADAVGNHVRACADLVDVVSGPATIKRRFIETYPFQKLFEIYEMNEAAAAYVANDRYAHLLNAVPLADVVIMADYGHGFVTPALISLVSREAKFLAVNVQANAGNHGFNTISKYPRANFISLSERELRLDARDQTSSVDALMCRASASRNATVLITRGAHGCRALAPAQGIVDAPAMASQAVDHMGAGDAVFGVTACCAAVGMPVDLIAFVASVVGAQAVGIVGNQRSIERASLLAQIESLFV